ncbi:HAD-IIIC family phosphatase [Lentzea sp. CA-135723]|uniref:HAD-IIIC family phosphatase n=1 Tax=Lentzea sp. CA-135723 TaxID=3239950 RepID=UPI003D89BAA9
MPDAIKCVVWDLDETLWQGTVLEGDRVVVPERNRDLVRRFDAHGVLQSVASRNDADVVLPELAATGLQEYFLYPMVGWSAKSASVRAIAAELNIATDSLLFVDDSEFERAEVAAELPEVRCVAPEELHELVARGELLATAPTADAIQRRPRYQAEQRRREHEKDFAGPAEEFLRSLDMRLTVADATTADLARAAELTQRTHQLNTTGITFDEQALAELIEDPGHRVLVARLTDRFGEYGTIGLVVVQTSEVDWTLRLLLMSCRVMGRNIGTAVVGAVTALAREAGAGLLAHFRPTDRNRQMRLTYRLLGFEVAEKSGDLVVFRLPGTTDVPIPGYVALTVPATTP